MFHFFLFNFHFKNDYDIDCDAYLPKFSSIFFSSFKKVYIVFKSSLNINELIHALENNILFSI